jgi:inhibitor of cysteine peptidase
MYKVLLVLIAGLLVCAEVKAEEKGPIAIKVGESFTITVEANPSTGYSWFPEYDAGFLKLENSAYEPPNVSIPGKPGTHRFTFVGLKGGELTVRLIYKRPWEEKENSSREYEVRINQ